LSAAAPPQKVGKYEIRGVLGRGAMGIVYDGWDPVIHRRVAIKTVRLLEEQDPDTAEGLDRFKREAQAAGRLTHPNIVGVFDFGETEELAYIVMEFVEGRSLKAILDADLRLPANEAVRVMQDVLAGLAYSHGRGVIHRDIKPANIIITPDNQAKIADFGIARIEASNMTQAGTVMGTPAYMSPEQFMGQPVDCRTDVYSCGIMLYQLLTGERPFEGSMTAIMHKAMTATPPKPSDLAVTAPAVLDPVVARAMARRPEDRFASAADFAQALRDPRSLALEADGDATVVGRAPTSAAAPSTRPAPQPAAPPAPAAPRSRAPLLAGVGVVLIAGAAAAFFLLPKAEQPQPPSAPPSAPSMVATAVPAVPPVAAPAPQDHPAPRQAAEATPPRTLPPATAAVSPAPQEAVPAEPAPAQTVPVPAAPAVAPASPQVAPVTTPQQQAAIVPQPVVVPPPSASVAKPIMASPPAPPDPASILCSLVQPATALANAKSEPAIQQVVAGTAVKTRIVDDTFCPVLDALRAIGNAPDGALSVAQDGGAKPLHDNQVIALHATMPAFAGYLSVAYVQHDRTVAPLVPGPGYPRMTYPAHSRITLGNPRQNSPGWLVGPPFGEDMIVVVASTAPLFQTPLAETQTMDTYLSALQAAVDDLHRHGGTVSAAALPIDTLPAP